jgi:DHA1 family bicyclomycin/chloramphenicol resistance-like MFS transporter
MFNPNSLLYFLIMACLVGLPPLSIDMNLPGIPAIEAAFGTSPGQGALTFSFFLLGFSVAPLIMGPLSDRFGRKPILLISLFFISVTAFVCMLGTSFHLLLASRLAQGMACGSCVLAPLAIIRDTLEGGAARRKLSGIMFVMGVAPLVAPLAGSAMLAIGGWRAIYGAQGGLGLILLLLVWVGFAETLPPERRASLNVRTLASRYRALFSSRDYLGLALLMAFGFGCMFSYISGSPGLLLRERGLSEEIYALFFAFTSFGLMLGSMGSAILGRREVHATPIINWGLTGFTLLVGGVVLLTWFWADAELVWLLAILTMMMFCFGMIQPNALAEAVAPWASMAGTASGGLNSLQMFVGAGASTLVTGLSGVLPAGRAMSGAMAFFIFLAVAGYLLLRPSVGPKPFQAVENFSEA